MLTTTVGRERPAASRTVSGEIFLGSSSSRTVFGEIFFEQSDSVRGVGRPNSYREDFTTVVWQEKDFLKRWGRKKVLLVCCLLTKKFFDRIM